MKGRDSMPTDTERLDWMTRWFDLGDIRLDPDLEGQPLIEWSVWNEPPEGFTNPRDAIDAGMARHTEQEARMRSLG